MTRFRFSPGFVRAFEWVFRPWMQRRLAGIHIRLPDELLSDVPTVLVANHVSWFDGFLLRELQRRLRPRAPLATVMLQQELHRHRFLRHLGVIGVTPGRPLQIRALLRTLHRAAQKHPDLVISFFPQGEVRPSFARPLRFRRGIELVLRNLAPVQILPVAIHLEPLTEPAPTAFVQAGSPTLVAADAQAPTVNVLEAQVAEQLDTLLGFLARAGEHAVAAWPKERSQSVLRSEGTPPEGRVA